MDRMNDSHLTQSNSNAPTDTRRKGKGYAWAALAVFTCPCHLPILVVLLSGTALGAALAENLATAAAVFVGVFLISVVVAMRLLKDDRGLDTGTRSKGVDDA